MSHSIGEGSEAANPFPPTAVASYSAPGGISIRTKASIQAEEVLESYLRDASEGPQRGKTVAIVGDFGTGKTHLALDMLRELDLRTNGESTLVFVDVPGDTFLCLYKERFLPRIDRQDLRCRVLDYYSEVVAEELDGSELTAPIVEALRSGTVNPELVVQKYSLATNRLAKSLAERLRDVTQQPEFAAALTLFLRPEYESAVWQWLGGSAPDPALRERGVYKTIDSDVDALEAMGVIALLHGQRGRHFALVLDELEKILVPLAQADGGEATLLGLKRLMEICARAGALLILCGLPDYFELLPEDARQRVSLVIRPARLTGDDTERFIADSRKNLDGKEGLYPFTPDTAAYIASIAAGNPRRIIRLCYLLYQASSSRGTLVTRALVREIAKEQYETFTEDTVREELVRIFDRRGWQFEPNRHVENDKRKKGGRADFWLPSGTGDDPPGCAVILTASVLDQEEAKRLSNRAKTLASADPSVSVFAVVNGRVADTAQEILANAPVRLFEFDDDAFTNAFDAALAGVLQRLERDQQTLSLSQVLDRLDQLGRQMTNLSRGMEKINEQSDASRVEGAVEVGLRRAFSSLANNPNDYLAVYPAVRALIDRTLDAIKGEAERVVSSGSDPFSRLRGATHRPDVEALNHLTFIITTFGEQLGTLLPYDPSFLTRGHMDQAEGLCRHNEDRLRDFFSSRTWSAAGIDRDHRVEDLCQELPSGVYGEITRLIDMGRSVRVPR